MKTKLLITLLAFSLIISCYGYAPAIPENIAKDYLNAIASDNCLKASRYWVTQDQEEFFNICREARCKIVEANIDDHYIQHGSDPILPQQKVWLFGNFVYRCDDPVVNYTRGVVVIWFRNRDNKWKIFMVDKELE